MHIIDRRLNPGGKSLPNRQRFLRRAKALVQRAVRDTAVDRDVKDLNRGGEVAIPTDGIREPTFRRSGTGGVRNYVLPGNKRFVEGDTIKRPEGGAGAGGSEGGTDGGGEDEFRFMLSRDEFLKLFLDDLDLPNLAKRRLASTEVQGIRRAGFTSTGSPANLALTRTLRNSLARRIAMHRRIDPRRRCRRIHPQIADQFPVIVLVIERPHQPQLPMIVHALDLQRFSFRSRERRQQHARQDRDNGNDHQ